MTERFAYLAFLTVVGAGLAAMTAGLAAVWILLLRQNRLAKRPDRTPDGARGAAEAHTSR